MFKKFLGAAAVVGAVIVAGVVGFHLLDNPFTTVTKDHSPPPVLAELRDLSDFHAAQAQFEVTLDVELRLSCVEVGQVTQLGQHRGW